MINNGSMRPFRADHVGSFLRPDEIMQARQRRERGEIDAAGLRAVEDTCIRELVAMQEELGLRSVTDGEFRRRSWNADFLAGFRNVKKTQGRLALFHRNPDGTNTDNQISAWEVTDKIERDRPIQVKDFEYLKSVAKQTPKTCIPSPTLLHFRGGRKAISEKAYPEMSAFFADVARLYNAEMKDLYAAGCRYLQLDDTNFAYLCDARFRDAAQAIGEDPDELVTTYCKLVNDSLKDRPKDMLVGIHLCRGNSSTAGAAAGSYEAIAEEMFGTLDVDAFFLEYDDERAGDFQPLRFVPKGKTVVLGLITTKRAEIESQDTLKRRIDEAATVVPMEHLCLSPQCGFASGASFKRRIEISDEQAKIRLLVGTAHDVWGGM